MLTDPNCAVCKESNWDEMGAKVYLRSDTPEDNYKRVRHDVLFDLWFPGQNKVSLTPILCRTCGFLCYRPRPQNNDIAQKYDYIALDQQAGKEFTVNKKSDAIRSRELFNTLRKYLKNGPKSILDYGGGNGRLLHDFVNTGHRCFTLELVDDTLPGVSYAGEKPSDLESLEPFDVLVCSHVLEHLSDPLDTLTELLPFVHTEGVVYIEVPSEIWHRPPPAIDPVTHINFFTTDSLRALLEAAGLDVISCKYESFTRPNSRAGIAIKAIAKHQPRPLTTAVQFPGPNMVYAQLKPSIARRIERLIRNPRMLLNSLHVSD